VFHLFVATKEDKATRVFYPEYLYPEPLGDLHLQYAT
jgi:hypothetical protein